MGGSFATATVTYTTNTHDILVAFGTPFIPNDFVMVPNRLSSEVI
jgi:hypothetical protein